MYVIHDSLVGEETVTFAYIRARVVTRMCFPASFVEYLWILSHFPLCCTSLLDLVSCSISFKLQKGTRSWHAPVAQQTPSAWLAFRPLSEPLLLPCTCSHSLSRVERQMEAESSSTPSLWAQEHIRPGSCCCYQGRLQVYKGILRL